MKRKILALLLSAVMLLGLLPISALAATDEPYEEPTCPQCGGSRYDSYGEPWEDGATCTQPGERHYGWCGNCGEVTESIPPLGHLWNEGYVSKEPTCTQPGERVYYCGRVAYNAGGQDIWRCSESKTETIPALGHQWDKGKVIKEPTCTEKGTVLYTCTRSTRQPTANMPIPCGATRQEDKPALGHDWTEWQRIKEPTPYEQGVERRYCRRCSIEELRYLDYIPPRAEDVRLEKVVSDTTPPVNGEYYTVGEEILYHVTLSHVEERRCLTNTSITDPLYADGSVKSSTESGLDLFSTFGLSFTYTVTTEDVLRGYIENTAEATYSFEGEEELRSIRSNTVTVPTGRGSRNDDELPGGDVSVSKYVTSNPANGQYYVLGETVSYAVSVSVPKDPSIHHPTVRDSLLADPLCYLEGIQTVGGMQVNTYDYVVTQQDVDEGQVDNIAWVEWTDDSGVSRSCYSGLVAVPTGEKQDDFIAPPSVTKTVTSSPKNGLYYTEGETITYDVLVLNPLSGDRITELRVADQISNGTEIDFNYVDFAEMSVEDDRLAQFSHTVTAADVEEGYVSNMAWLVYTDANGVQHTTPPAFCTVPTASEEDEYSASVTKAILSTPGNGLFYTPGEKVVFEITVTNTGKKPLKKVAIRDHMDGYLSRAIPEEVRFEVNETRSFIFEYTVSEWQAGIGTIYNTASIAIQRDDGTIAFVDSNIVAVPTGFGFGVITEVELYKQETSSPKNGSYYTAGETISYSITMTNTGETDFGECIVYDVLGGGGSKELGSAEMFHAGESRTYTFDYTVTAADVTAGFVANSAVASCDNNGYPYTAVSNTVISDTDGVPDFPDGFPGGSPDGSPWIPGVTPPGGTIDGPGSLDGEHGDESCTVTLVKHSEGAWEFRHDFCTIHNGTRKAVEAMLSTASGDSAKLTAIEQAKELWTADIEELYDALLEHADTLAKTTILEEQISFFDLVQNREAMLKTLYPKDPVRAGSELLRMLEEHCNVLCYELHKAPSARPDHFGGTVAAGIGELGERCACERSTGDAKVTCVGTLCAAHASLDSTAKILLDSSTADRAWLGIYRLWLVELQSSFNRLGTALGEEEEHTEAIGSYYRAVLRYAEAREKLLGVLYAGDSAVICEVMTREIRDTVMALCGAVPEQTEDTQLGFSRSGKRR